MTKEDAKKMVGDIYGPNAASDDDIVDFYLMVNETAFDDLLADYHLKVSELQAENAALRAENERLRGLLEDRVRSHAYGVVCRRMDVVINGGPTDELLQKECDKAWNFYKTENNL